MLEELDLHDLRFLLEHRLANAAGNTAEQAMKRLQIYLGRWPRSASLLRAAIAAARGLEDAREVEYVERLGDVLLELGEPVAAMRCYRQARDLRPRSTQQGPTHREKQARAAAEAHVRPAAEFHKLLVKHGNVTDPAERAEAWQRFLSVHPNYGPAIREAIKAYADGGEKPRAAQLASDLGRQAFVAGARKPARHWLSTAVSLDPDRDEALLYLAEMSGGVPEDESIRNQRVTLLRRMGLYTAALTHRERELTGGERDRSLLEEMADIASEWGGDPASYLVRRAQFELDGGHDDEAKGFLEAAIERSPDQPAAIRMVLAAPGVTRALGNSAVDKLRSRLTETEVPPQPASDEASPGG
jgi:tetratricopeptide (TPR) repeat protein